MCQQHPQFLTAYRLHMHRAIKPRPHHLRYAARIVAVRLVDLRLQHRLHVPRLNADHRQSCFGESAEQPLRQRSSFQPNSLEVVGGVLQHRQQRFRFARHLYFPNDLACVIHNADARVLDRNVQSSKVVHAALLLLMLEAMFTDLVFTISPKRSTQNLQLSTSCRPITPSFGHSRRARQALSARRICANVRLVRTLPAPALVVQREVEMKRALSVIAGVGTLAVTLGVETANAQSYRRYGSARAYTPHAYTPQSRGPVR